MEPKKVKKISKFLSLVLRHRPEVIGVTMDKSGWVNTNELIEKCKAKGHHFTLSILEEVVSSNDKKRFAFNEDKSKIRASQGHSVQIDLGYSPVDPPEFLYHGTATRFVENIAKEGLLKRNRHQVHLSYEKNTAHSVGTRHGKPVILVIRAKEMQAAGHHFYISENGVWLTDLVPVEYIDFPS